ncbi:MAG: hypothetical protein J6M58_09050, partial [Clostridium sp.]|nr:hypothetical protein [Clostridium sp.]
QMAKNRISAVFLTALFLILCGLWPVSACLLQGGTPEDTGENRTLAAYPELKNLRDLERFPAGFEAWLNDHMPAKTALVGSQSALELGLFGEMAQDKVVFGTSRPWLFNRSEDGQPLETYKRTNLFSEEELDRISQNLSEMQQDFSDAGIRMVLMISPDKEQIYGDDYMPSSVAVLENEGRTEQLIGALGKTCPSLPVVYPAELLRKGREKEEVYYASDTHWNRIGACIACGALVDTLAEDTGSTWPGAEAFRERYHFSEKEKKAGDLQKLVRLGEEFDSTEYEAQEARTAEVSDVSEDVRGEVIRERSSNPGGLPLNVYLSGDSFRWNLTRFLQDGVNKSTVTSRYYLDLEDVVAQEPDVFVYMIAERYLHELDRIPGYNTQALTY